MKKILTVIMCAFVFSAAALPVMAQGKQGKAAEQALEVIKGTVVSVNAAKKEMTVKEDATGTARTFTVSEKAAVVVKAGDRVRVKTKAGSSVAESVKTINMEQKAK